MKLPELSNSRLQEENHVLLVIITIIGPFNVKLVTKLKENNYKTALNHRFLLTVNIFFV